MKQMLNVSHAQVGKAFNEWMHRFTEHPEQFAHEWQTVAQFVREKQQGFEPTYGQVATEYLVKLLGEVA